ncbi:MAG: ABC transporter ATP-binding protein [Flavobacteriaceae bacterium]|nr:ABC transporter ATP-binding protein [Flavobacteriaceae bacterium]
MTAIRVQNISKSYANRQVLNQVSFDVEKGELFGLIGPDGAGKTSIFRILTTLILPSSGQAFVMQHDIQSDYQSIRNQVGYMPGKFSLYQDLSVEENLHFFASLFGSSIQENYHLIRDIYKQIEPFKKRRAGKLSGGMKQKLALSCALINNPSVLFLDEPTTGVDAVSRREFWEMLQNLKQKGITILVSTPYMDEAVLCDKIALIQHGKIMQIGTPKEIVETFPKKLFALQSTHNFKLKKILNQIPEVESIYSFGDKLHLTLKHQSTDIESITNKYLQGEDFKIKEIQASIEDVFIRLTQNMQSKNAK